MRIGTYGIRWMECGQLLPTLRLEGGTNKLLMTDCLAGWLAWRG
jgi:hypothetical protein